MGKIVLLAPGEEILHQAHNLLQEKKYAVDEMRVVRPENTVTEARASAAAGASILIAGGRQASLIKQYTDIPVAEIVVTAQEMALLVVKAKQILKKERPVIAVIGLQNMFCEMSYFDSIYDIELRTYFTAGPADLEDRAGEAIAEGADLIIGGDTAVAAAERAGIPSLFLSITEDSLRGAFFMAETMDYAMSAEKKGLARIETVPKASFDGAVNLDRQERFPASADGGRERGLLTRGNFQWVLQKSKAMEDCVHLARLYSQSERPVLILGEAGTEKRLLAESIHNTGPGSSGAFAALSCRGLSEEVQREMIFGDRGAAVLANGGTLYLEEVDCLAVSNQQSLCELIRRGRIRGRRTAGEIPLKVRVIVSSSLLAAVLRGMEESGAFHAELYYELAGLVLKVPPLRERREDLEQAIHDLMEEACGQYSRYHVLTKGGLRYLTEYGWPGNGIQLESFIKRLVLTAERRSIDEVAVKKLLTELYPCPAALEAGQGPAIRSEEEVRIRQALQKYSGSREKTAAALGISTATLWRKMKKYCIDGNGE